MNSETPKQWHKVLSIAGCSTHCGLLILWKSAPKPPGSKTSIKVRRSMNLSNDNITLKMYCTMLCHLHTYALLSSFLCLSFLFHQVYFGASVARYYLAFHSFGLSCFTGMSYLVKKNALDELNGLSWFGRFLAEDFFIAKYLHKK